jgi:hypothetical protein
MTAGLPADSIGCMATTFSGMWLIHGYTTAEAGIVQFLDFGTGIPAAGNTHGSFRPRMQKRAPSWQPGQCMFPP